MGYLAEIKRKKTGQSPALFRFGSESDKKRITSTARNLRQLRQRKFLNLNDSLDKRHVHTDPLPRIFGQFTNDCLKGNLWTKFPEK